MLRTTLRRPRALAAALLTLSLGLAAWLGLGAARPLDAAPRAAGGPHTVLLVRHAEKAADGGQDPALSERGRERALALARLLAASGPDHLFASEYRRTQETLAPLAEATGIAVETRPARAVAELAAELAALPAGSLTLVSGHSNTVPALVRALGGEAGELGEDDYDRLFVLGVGGGAACPTTTLELRYGD